MPFKVGSKMSNRREFVTLARIEGANIRELCRRFGVSPTVGYKWIERSKQDGETFEDRSRKPHHSPKRTEDEQTETVQPHRIPTLRRYGLPWRMNMDNGRPWGNPTGDPYTKLTVWLIRIGIAISHSRPLHPQTNGKDERFHRTLNAELL